MAQITRNIDPASALDLLARPARACLAFAGPGGALALPVALAWSDEQVRAGVPERAQPQLGAGQEAVLLADEGIYFFDLRAIYLRGRLEPVEAPAGAPAGYRWFVLAVQKTVAWDYGALREVPDGA